MQSSRLALVVVLALVGCQSLDSRWHSIEKLYDSTGNILSAKETEAWFHVPGGVNTVQPFAGPEGAGAKGTTEAPKFANWVYSVGAVLLLALAGFLAWKGMWGAAAPAAGAALLCGAIPYISPALGGLVTLAMYAGVIAGGVWAIAHFIGHKSGVRRAWKGAGGR